MRDCLIYGLQDPRTGEVRYIGKTNNLTIRIRKHLYDAARDKRNQYVYNWIKQLLALGLKPDVGLIEDGLTADEASERETHWIRYYRSVGNKLTNENDGGLGFGVGKQIWKGRKHSDETKRKMSESGLGKVRSIDSRLRMSAAKGGSIQDPVYSSKLDRGAPAKSINMYDAVSGNFIRRFSSLLEASKVLGINRGHIKMCALSGKPYLTYKFKFEEELT